MITISLININITGDRIAIISKGSLLCCGSFEYLKHHFGHGLRLTLVTRAQSERRPSLSSRTFTVTAEVEEQDHTDAASPCIVIPDEQPSDESINAEATSFIQSIITGATMIEKRGRELHYRLPLPQARPRVLANLFSLLEEQKERLGVVSYGLSSCTMEEVSAIFMLYIMYVRNVCTYLADFHAVNRTRVCGK